MSLNLITDPWIPIRRRDQRTDLIRPADVVDVPGDNPPVAIESPRPDFNGALLQWLIALFQTFAPPKDPMNWWGWLTSPPSPEHLQERLQPYAHYFDLHGDVSFMQEKGGLPDGKKKPLFDLLLDSPGNQTKKRNQDIFNKRRDDYAVCAHCAAMTLLTMQLNAPSGGRGHRTSVRGGGPVSTVLRGDRLWHAIWLNIISTDSPWGHPPPSEGELHLALPWLTSTRTSEKKTGVHTHPTDVHPLHALWNLPRRLDLCDPHHVGEPLHCHCCDRRTHRLYSHYRDRPYGTNYKGPWIHPLTPYDVGDEKEPNPLKTPHQGFTYKYWRGLVATAYMGNKTRQPASVVAHFRAMERLRDRDVERPDLPVHLWAFGYDCDNAKIRSWHDVIYPFIGVSQPHRPLFDTCVAELIEGAEGAEYQLKQALKRGLYGTVTKTNTKGHPQWRIADQASIDNEIFTQSSMQFWRDTEAAFYECLTEARDLLDAGDDDRKKRDAIKRRWTKTLKTACHKLYDRITGYGNFHNANPKSLAMARNALTWFFNPDKGGITNALTLHMSTLEEASAP